jgi:hypothetical protein
MYKTDFINDGYCIEKNLITKNENAELFFMFYDLAISIIIRNKINHVFKIIRITDLKYPKNLKELDKVLLLILKFDNKLIGELYDTVSYSSTFLKVVSNSQIEKITKSLLNITKKNTIYSWTHRVRIDPPKDERRTYGWHQEIFYTIPNTKFVQTWCPLIRDASVKNGTIEVCAKSHKGGIAKQSWNETKGKATQIIVDEEIVNQFTKKKISMKIGDVLFFDPHLFHRSGHNSTQDEIRFSLVGMWNDTTIKGFRAPKPNFKSRTYSAKENYNRLMIKKKNN